MLRKWILAGVLVQAVFFGSQSLFATEGPVEQMMKEQGQAVLTDCQDDLNAYCSTVTPGGNRGVACLYAHEDKITPQCKFALYEAGEAFDQMSQAIRVFGQVCQRDLSSFCSGVPEGEGRLLNCLMGRRSELSAECGEFLARIQEPAQASASIPPAV